MLPAVLTALLFASSVILGHRAAKLAGSLEANFWRVILASAFLSLWAFTFGSGFSGAGLWWFALSGAVGVGFGDFAIYHALPRLGPRICSLVVQCLMGVFGVLLDWLCLGTQITSRQILFSAITLSGVTVALGTIDEIKQHARSLGPGLLMAAFGAAATAGGAVISSKAFKVIAASGGSLDGITAGFQRMLGGLVVSLSVYCALRVHYRASRDPLLAITTPERRKAWVWIAANSLAGQTLGVSAMQWALATTKASQVLVIVATAPILVIPLARIFEGERIAIRALVGAVIAVGGVIALILSK
jgi:drug/metabolite transporter (DMT)-like permease